MVYDEQVSRWSLWLDSTFWFVDQGWHSQQPFTLFVRDARSQLKTTVKLCYLISIRFEPLACRQGQDPNTCLSIDQIDTLHKIYSDVYDTNQTFIYGGFYPGSELGLTQYIFGTDPGEEQGVSDFFRYFITKFVSSTLLKLYLNRR